MLQRFEGTDTLTDRAILKSAFSMGAFRVEPLQNKLRKSDTEYALEPRIMDVLCALAAQPGEVLSREDLIDRIWKIEHGADESLTRAISQIRKTIREADEDSEYIETIPKRGYRLVQPVTLVGPEPRRSNAPKPHVPIAYGENSRTGLKLAVLMAGIALLAAAFALPGLFSNTPPAAAKPAADLSSPVEVALPSLAVLPLRAISTESDDQQFADGLAYNVLASLGKLSDLNVAGHRSSFAYRDDAADVRTIGGELGVDYLLDGTLQRAGDRVRVSAELLRADDGFQMWTEVYDAPLADVLRVQDDIVRQISRQLEIELGVGRYRFRPEGEGIHPDAVEQYYLGLGYFAERMRSNNARLDAFNAFRQAAVIDPDFGEAWTGIALIGATSRGSPLGRDVETFTREIGHAFERALALNPDDPSTHAAMVFWSLGPAFDMTKAKAHAEKAMALNPLVAEVVYADAAYKLYAGEVAEGLAIYDRAVAAQPENLAGALVRARWLATTGRFEDAFAFFDPCQTERCLQEGFVAFASIHAVMSGDQERIAAWTPHWEEFETFLETLPPEAKPQVTRILPAYFSIVLDRPDKPDQVAFLNTLFVADTITESIGAWAPVFAGILPEDVFFQALEQAADTGDLLGGDFALTPFYGTNPYPEWVLRHPRYHGLFERPKLAEFARIRRANGWTDGLPLPANP